MGLHVKHAPVVRQRHVHVSTSLVESVDQRGGDIGQATGFGVHLPSPIAEVLR